MVSKVPKAFSLGQISLDFEPGAAPMAEGSLHTLKILRRRQLLRKGEMIYPPRCCNLSDRIFDVIILRIR